MQPYEASVWEMIKQVVGKKVHRLHRVLVIHGEKTAWDEGYLQFTFSDGTYLLLKGSANGAVLGVSEPAWNDPLTGILDLETQTWIELHGKWELVDVSSKAFYCDFTGKKIHQIYPILYKQDFLCGVQFVIDSAYLNFVYIADSCRVLWGKNNPDLSKMEVFIQREE